MIGAEKYLLEVSRYLHLNPVRGVVLGLTEPNAEGSDKELPTRNKQILVQVTQADVDKGSALTGVEHLTLLVAEVRAGT